MDDDWGLNAIVRSCTNAAATTNATVVNNNNNNASAAAAAAIQDDNFLFLPVPDLLTQPRLLNMQNTHELHDLFKPFSPKSKPINFPLQDLSPIPSPSLQHTQAHEPEHEQKQRSSCSVNNITSSIRRPCPKTKRRKQLQKRVCQVPPEGLSSDVWSWRKYGQKPIKGSPYPRGYYKCSTSKLCMARKQVERCRSDPSMFILTYTGEHNHPMPSAPRNQVAGIIRQKPDSDSAPARKDSGNEEKMDNLLNEINGEIGVDETVVSDDFFEGLEELAGGPVIGNTVFSFD